MLVNILCALSILMLSNVLVCEAGCEFPWVQPGENTPCYAVSTSEVNYFDADQVSIGKCMIQLLLFYNS